MALDMVSIIFPLATMIIMGLFVALLTNKSAPVIVSTCGMVLAILIWKGIIPQAFYVVVAMFIGVSLWMSVGISGGPANE